MIRLRDLLRRWLTRGSSLQKSLARVTSLWVALAVLFIGSAAYLSARNSMFEQLDQELVEVASYASDPISTDVQGLGGLNASALQAANVSLALVRSDGQVWRVQGMRASITPGVDEIAIARTQQGSSTRSTIGNEEHRDVLGAWDWLVSEKGFDPSKIGLFANSLGGANANYAFAAEPRIAALFLQSTFGNLQQIISAELTRNNYPTFLAPGALLMGSILTGTNLFARNPVETIRQAAGRPVYIVHTRADTRIAISQSEQLAAAAQAAGVNVTTWFPDNGEHVQTPAAYPDEFEQRMVGFFRSTFGD